MYLRPMRPADAVEVARLSGQLGYPASPAQMETRLVGLAGDPDSALFVVEEEDGRILGWAHVARRIFVESDPYAELCGLVVDETARRGGVGRRLVEAVERWGAERGLATMRIRSNTRRVEARPFYESLGYVVGKTQYVFQKPLRPPPRD